MEQLELPPLEALEIPDKRVFKIGEVAKLLDLEPYVLRYWEKEFEVLEPNKTDSGQRAYKRDDIQLLATIRELLYEEMFTIDGARRQLELTRKGEPSYLSQTMGEDAASADEGTQADAQEAAELERENDELRAEVERLREERGELADQNEELDDQLELARAELAEERESRADAVHQWRRTAEQLRDENDDLEDRVAGLQEKLEQVRSERDTARQKADHAGGVDAATLDSLRREVDALVDLI